MNKVCIYLRKSRADEELEKTLGQGETLIKHRKALLKYAKLNKLDIVEIKEEIVSGDSLFFRPKMLELLKEVEDNEYNGVLVMDIDRLGRGGMKDQGIILDAFKESNTKIITPLKTYDLNNEFDEEITEFKTFFSRRELKTINRRMQGGRVRSVEDGNYIATNPPLGYDIEYIQKSRILKINEHEAEIVKIIFQMYTNGNGASSIANHLNSLGFKTKINKPFTPSSVLFIIKNPVYIGKVTWKKKDIKKSMQPGKKKETKTRDKSEWIIANGKHKPIISQELWDLSQEILKKKYHVPYQLEKPPINPLAGILKCGVCGKAMVMRESRGFKRIMCIHKCGNRSARFEFFEDVMLKELRKLLEKYKFEISIKNKSNDLKLYTTQLKELEKELTTLNDQKNKLFDFLERGLYTEDIFIERSKNLNERISAIESNINNIQIKLDRSQIKYNKEFIYKIDNVIDAYKTIDDIKTKNMLLREIVVTIEYFKSQTQRNDDFEIVIHPRLPL